MSWSNLIIKPSRNAILYCVGDFFSSGVGSKLSLSDLSMENLNETYIKNKERLQIDGRLATGKSFSNQMPDRMSGF